MIPCRTRAQAWERLGPEGGNALSLADASDGSVVYLGTPDGHVFASADGGANWELRGRLSETGDAVVQRLVVDSRDAKTVWAASWTLAKAQDGGLYRSTDGARTWSIAGLAG